VTTNDCKLKTADITPLNNPNKLLITKAITIVKAVPQLCKFVAQRTAVKPTIAPTEISIPPVIITKVKPSATRAIMVDCTPISRRISLLRNTGSRNPKIAKVNVSAIKTPKTLVFRVFVDLLKTFTRIPFLK
jgi:hypothetical protein